MSEDLSNNPLSEVCSICDDFKLDCEEIQFQQVENPAAKIWLMVCPDCKKEMNK